MEIGIIGLSKSGKTTLFRALTRGKAERTGEALHIGVTKVPDPRLDTLARIFKPQRVIPAEIKYWDIPGQPEGLSRTGIGGQFLNILQKADALLNVVRAFQDPSVPHPEGSVDPLRDAAVMWEELAFSDLGILERRVQRIEAGLKGAKGHQRDVLAREKALLERVKEGLEGEVPIREQEFDEEEARTIANYQFLTAKPLLLVVNIGEEELGRGAELEREVGERYKRPGVKAVAMCGKLEMELSELEPEEEREFRESLGLTQSGSERAIRASYELMGLVSFFTVVSQEVRAWTVPRGTPAVKAAGKIHSDMERGFIRAEVISFSDLARCGSIAEGRRQGLLRLEGKGYPVQDGDVITFLFNV